MKPITIFSWGYYGWGNAPEQFVKAVDAVERNRGFKAPLFVEVRFQRTGRAEGFKGSNFENLLGPRRYKWMKELGNKAVASKSGPAIQIADPSAAAKLLDLAVEGAAQDRRLLFFCGCQWPKENGKIACHRTAITSLLLKAAKKQGVPIEVVEWPGGKPGHLDLKVKPVDLRAVIAGRRSIPLGNRPDLAEVASLPWGSTVTLQSGRERRHLMTGPATFERGQWVLTVWSLDYDSDALPESYQGDAKAMRKDFGLNPVSS